MKMQRLPARDSLTLLQKYMALKLAQSTSFQPPAMALRLLVCEVVAPYAYRVPPVTGVSCHWDATHCLVVSEGFSSCQ